MLVHFEFTSAFSNVLGVKELDIHPLESPSSLDTVLETFFNEYPEYQELVKRNHTNSEDKFAAMFICNETILKPDSLIEDGARVKVLGPICGG